MPDFRGIPLVPTGPGGSIMVTLELAEPNMTVGNSYEVLGMVIDNAPTSGPPRPSAIVFADDGHFKLVEFAKLKGTPAVQPAP